MFDGNTLYFAEHQRPKQLANITHNAQPEMFVALIGQYPDAGVGEKLGITSFP